MTRYPYRYPYLDPTLSSDDRVDDLLPRLSLQQKAGLMFQTIFKAGPIDVPQAPLSPHSLKDYLEKDMNHFSICRHFETTREYCELMNEIQKIAEERGLGIPVTISSDPRHGFSENPAASMTSGVFSQWPDHIGMAALADPARMEEFADIVRQEYVAIGIRAALHPQVDLATEYQWSRIAGGLGEDSQVASKLGAAHIRGLQGLKLGHDSVTACVKHFPGCAPTRHGYDPHFSWGSDLIYPGDNFDYHLDPFKAAIAAGTRVMMAAYGKPIGTKYEEVSMAFNKGILTDLLRSELGYEGVILSDFGILNDFTDPDGTVGDFARRRAWGLEHLTAEELAIKALDAGVDQFGGEHCPELIVKIVRSGRVSEERIDTSARKLLKDKLDLGLFDNRYLDPERAEAIVGCQKFRDAGIRAQIDSITLLKNNLSKGKAFLPLPKGIKVYAEGFKDLVAPELLTVVNSVAEAEVAVIRLVTPHEVIGEGIGASWFHHGKLDFPQETIDHVAELAKVCPVIVVINVDRPPILESLNELSSALLLTYGASGASLAKVLVGEESPKGKLPFDLPRSMAAIEASKGDTPFDTEDPFYRFGHGLTY